MLQKTKASRKTRYSRRQTCARSYQIKSKCLSSNRLLGFRQTSTTPRQDPSADQLGADYTAWLRKNFAWLFNPQGITSSSLGTAYVYGDAELGQHSLLGEYGNGDAKGKGRTEYIWLPTQGGNSIPVGIYRNGKFYAVHSDHLGTPRLITDDDNTPVWQWAYSAFGDNKPTGVLKATHSQKQAVTITPTALRNTTPIEMNLRMPGQYFDEESGLFYNYFRNYQPNQGRYTQSDPIGLGGGANRYGYANQKKWLGLFEHLSPKDKWSSGGSQRCRVVHGGGGRLRRTDRRGGQLGAHHRFSF